MMNSVSKTWKSKTVCAECGTSTIGYIISTQGGSRVLSVGTSSSRKLYCRPCGEARIAKYRAADQRRIAKR